MFCQYMCCDSSTPIKSLTHINIERGAKSVARFHRIKALALPSLSERATLKAPRR